MHGPFKPEQTADMTGTSPPVSHKMTSEKRLQKFHTDDRSGSASDWLKKISLVVRPIRITIQIWVVTRFCSRFPDVILREETRSGVAKCRLFSQADMALRSPFCVSIDPC